MPSTTRHPLCVAAIAAALALLGACSGPGTASSAGAAPAPGASQPAGSAPAASPSAKPAAQDQSPLQEALWSHIGGDAPDADAQAAKQQQVEEAKAECMAQQGFEYVPVSTGPHSPTTAVADGLDTSSREFAAQYGYGESISQDAAGTDAQDAPANPNKAITDAMTPAEKTAYDRALVGTGKMGGTAPEGASPEGCEGTAVDTVYGKQDQFNQSEEMVALQADLTQLETDFTNDPKVVALNASWASCMADAGFGSYATPDDAVNDFVNRMSGYFAAQQSGSTPPPIDPALQDAERRTATADWDCKDHLHYQDVAKQAHYALEAQYVSSHKTQIDAVVAAYAAAGL